MNRRKSKKAKKARQNVEEDSIRVSGERSLLARNQRIVLLVLAIVVFAVYAHSGGFDFLYDDHKLILRQGRPESLDDFTRVFTERHWDNLPYYRPVSRLTMVTQKWMHGDQAGPFHLFNTLLMSICAVVASRLLCQPPFRIPFTLTVVGAGIFALHPAASSVVYPVCSGRETLIPAILMISCVALWIRGTRTSHVTAILLLPVALLSKEQSIITPALFFMADIFRISADAPKRDVSRIADWAIRFAPVVLIVIAYLVARRILFDGSGQHSLGLFQQPVLPLLSVLFAVQTMVLPFINLNYEPKVYVWLEPWRACLAVVALVFLCWMVLRSLRVNSEMAAKNSADAADGARSASLLEVVLFWLCWICFALAPTANLLKQEASFAERYVFLALLGVIGIVGAVLGPLWKDRNHRLPILVATGVIAVVCGAISFHRGSFYQNDDKFLNQWVKSDPQSGQARAALAEFYVLSNQVDQAWIQLEKAIEIDPASAPANNIIGYLLYRQGKPQEALPYLETALASFPGYSEAHNNYAVALSMLRRFDEAKKHYEAAIRINPNYAEPFSNQGLMYEQMQQYDLAIEFYNRAVAIDSSYVESHFGLGNIALRQNRLDDAQRHYRTAIQLAPRNPGIHINMGNVHRLQNNLSEAERSYRQALEIDPNNVLAREQLDLILQPK